MGRLRQKWDDIPTEIRFEGEFGAEVNSFIPAIYFLHEAGEMADRRVLTYKGMRPFYFFLSDNQLLEVERPRRYFPPSDRPSWLPNRDDHRSVRQIDEVFPNYRSQFARNPQRDKPSLIIHNKYTEEWGGPPINFIPLETLDKIFSTLSSRFQIYYFPAILRGSSLVQISEDHQRSLEFDEGNILAQHPEVVSFNELVESNPDKTYNELKLEIFADSFHYVLAQGGNVHLSSLFTGAITAVLHVQGSELAHSYARGHFAYASNPRSKMLICRGATQLEEVVPALLTSQIIESEAHFSSDGLGIYRKYGPQAVANRG